MTGILWLLIPAIPVLLCHKFASRSFRLRRLMAALPTSPVRGVFIGLVEVKGAAKGICHRSFLEETDALLSRYTVEEHYQRSTVGSDGKPESESGWDTVSRGGQLAAFFLEDETGALRVDPTGAELTMNQSFSYRCKRDDPYYYAKGPQDAIHGSTGERRFIEHSIKVDDPLYILGQARLREDVVAPEITADKEAGNRYLITTKSEEGLSRGAFWLGLSLGLVTMAVYPLLALIPGTPDFFQQPWFAPTTALLNLLLLFLLWAWRIYDDLVQVRNRVAQGLKNIDVQLKRRFDLIPNLVQVVKEISGAESSVHQAIAELRRGAEAQGKVTAVGRQLLLVSEQYPELQQSDAFLSLQRSLVDCEDRIALARDYFNEIATHANTLSEIIPDKFFVGLAGIKQTDLFQAEGFERNALVVNLDDLEAPS